MSNEIAKPVRQRIEYAITTKFESCGTVRQWHPASVTSPTDDAAPVPKFIVNSPAEEPPEEIAYIVLVDLL